MKLLGAWAPEKVYRKKSAHPFLSLVCLQTGIAQLIGRYRHNYKEQNRNPAIESIVFHDFFASSPFNSQIQLGA
jgi:hypothetical protein